jgi:hypothetical protein
MRVELRYTARFLADHPSPASALPAAPFPELLPITAIKARFAKAASNARPGTASLDLAVFGGTRLKRPRNPPAILGWHNNRQ